MTKADGRPRGATDEEILDAIDDADPSAINGWPTYRDVADELSISHQTVGDYCIELEEKGLIERKLSATIPSHGEVMTVRRCDDVE
jgi:Mn-dependent DtxR family transcriptional regulator